MKISDNLIKLLEEEEGWSATPYLCPAKVRTIGYGSTKWEDGRPVKSTDPAIDKKRGKALVEAHMEREVYPVMERAIKVDLNQNQFDAIADFIYNVGGGAFEKSTLLRKINAKDFTGAANEFQRWVRGGGRVLKGLVRRNEKRKALFLTPVAKAASPTPIVEKKKED